MVLDYMMISGFIILLQQSLFIVLILLSSGNIYFTVLIFVQVQKKLSELKLIPGMSQLFDKMSWLNETERM